MRVDMFHSLLLVLVIASSVHVYRMEDRSRERVGEILLLYLLVGYCGGPGLILSVISLLSRGSAAAALGFPPDNPFEQFLGWAYLGMSVVALLGLRFRGTYLVAPAVLWAIFFAGATLVHLGDFQSRGALSHGSMVGVLMSHALISVLVLATFWMSRAWSSEPPASSG